MKPIYLSLKSEVPPTGYWDHTFINDMLDGLDLDKSDRQIFIIPGAYQGDIIPEINAELAKYEKILVFITSDEENRFDVMSIKHPHAIVYSQYGNGGHYFPLGYTSETRKILKEIGPKEKTLDWFFSGQITHPRRKGMAEAVKQIPNGEIIETDGFAKGLSQQYYLHKMASAKFAPCSPGPISCDSFRVYEALEAGAIPIVDDMSPLKSVSPHYWDILFGDHLFPSYTDYRQISPIMNWYKMDLSINNRVFAWWINKKFQIREQLKRDLNLPKDDMVVVIPVSVIPSHPDTKIIDETISTVRTHTNSPIAVTLDGIREEQFDELSRYNEFMRRFLWKCNFEYKDVLPIIFPKHTHQVGMMREVLKNVDVPFVLYLEHDCPITPDREIPWEKLKAVIKSGESNLIRLHFEAFVPETHKHLMVGTPENDLLKTLQWSQRPHLASTEYYRKILKENFSDKANCFIEDKMHSVLQTHPWEDNKVHIYHPPGDIKRSYTTDGRAGNKKYDELQTF